MSQMVEHHDTKDGLRCFFKNAQMMPTKAQRYKTFYSCNLQMLVISWSVYPWEAFPA
jgi:hypothetical protein